MGVFKFKTRQFFQVVRECVIKNEEFRSFMTKHPSLEKEWQDLNFSSELFDRLTALMEARNKLRCAVYSYPELAREYVESLPPSISHPVIMWIVEFLQELNKETGKAQALPSRSLSPLWEC